MRRIYSTLCLFLLSLLFFQCQREVGFVGTPDVPAGQVATPDPITSALQGNVFDENGVPSAGVTVQVGSKTATTDARGYFRINAASLDKKSALVTATKAGYFKAYRTFAATAGANNVEIKLVKKSLTGTIDAAAGGDVSLSNGSKVALPANGVVTASNNAAYTGPVRVYASYIDPTATDIDQTVPGSLMADDKDGKRVTLTSYGMIAVEMEGASGEKLQIKSGATSTLTTAIPTSAQASAPATIALWSVDETTGIWKEEGTATKTGNVYVGQVKHYSFWNCDVSANAVVLSMTIAVNGEPLPNALVKLKRTTSNWTVSGITDSLGHVSGYVPYNVPLQMQVMDRCGNAIHTQNIGPFTQNTNIGIINVPPSSNALVTLKGKLVNCTNVAVTNGYAFVKFGHHTRLVSVNATGDFQTIFTVCPGGPTSFEILGVDNGASQQGTAATSVALVAPITNAGNISACGTSAAQFINYSIDGTNFSMSSPADSLQGRSFSQGTSTATTTISGESLSNPNRIHFSFSSANQVPGSFPMNSLRVNAFDSTSFPTPINITVTAFPAVVAGFYEGSFSGTFRDNSNVNHTISATFRVRRK